MTITSCTRCSPGRYKFSNPRYIELTPQFRLRDASFASKRGVSNIKPLSIYQTTSRCDLIAPSCGRCARCGIIHGTHPGSVPSRSPLPASSKPQTPAHFVRLGSAGHIHYAIPGWVCGHYLYTRSVSAPKNSAGPQKEVCYPVLAEVMCCSHQNLK